MSASTAERRGRAAAASAGRVRLGARSDGTAGKQQQSACRLELVLAALSIADGEPVVDVLTSSDPRTPDSLPSTPYRAAPDVALEDRLRAAIASDIGYAPGHLQQLTALVDVRREATVLIGYLSLVRDAQLSARAAPSARPASLCRRQGCFLHLPWEDWRSGRPAILDRVIVPHLLQWARTPSPPFSDSRAAAARLQGERAARIRLSFGASTAAWDEAKVLARFELLAEAGLIAEEAAACDRPVPPALGRVMTSGHRRILAAALGRLRADVKARPVVVELMDAEFSLYELQRTVEIVLGPHLHKQNFRRLVEAADLVEPTGGIKTHTGGRPARLYRYRRDVMVERTGTGTACFVPGTRPGH